jgi:tetratricopeptide (TPR) repeat protein
MSQRPPALSAEEQEQILQTIEMFEVIVQANPQDCQSMEILKDAYMRVGRIKETTAISRKLAETYIELGQYSSALLEYEGILKTDPDNPELIAALGDVEERLQKSGQTRQTKTTPGAEINLDFRAAANDTGTLITTSQTLRPDSMRSALRPEEVVASLKEDGNEALAKFLIQHKLINDEVVASALERVQKKNRDLAPNTAATSLIDEIVRRGAVELESLLSGILDRSKFAYIPLEYYDVDRQIVKMLPESLTLGRLIVPFDVLSRTVMIATANPFDALGKEAVQQILDYNIQWHLAAPGAILKVLGESYRLAGAPASVKPNGATPAPAPSADGGAPFRLAK